MPDLIEHALSLRVGGMVRGGTLSIVYISTQTFQPRMLFFYKSREYLSYYAGYYVGHCVY